MNKKLFIITAAGGNATAIQILDKNLKPEEYARRGKKIMLETKKFGVEQCGFLLTKNKHFEMSGGEFCGNAARAVAILLYQINKTSEFEFTMSGFKNMIQAKVKKITPHKYDVNCTFPNLQTKITPLQALGQKATLVDLGGIVHVIIDQEFPTKNYKNQHRQITKDLNLLKRSAVGVCWIDHKGDNVIMHPVVWVKNIDSFFYESSCGSGTIATAKITKKNKIIQPSGQTISVKFTNKYISLQSKMEIIFPK